MERNARRYVIEGQPVPQKRPRFAATPKGVRTYSTQAKEKERFQAALKDQCKGEPLTGPLEVELEFIHAVPASLSRPKAMKRYLSPHVIKPDIDNLSKAALDFSNGIVWDDDKQIVTLRAHKRYGNVPRTMMTVREVEP